MAAPRTHSTPRSAPQGKISPPSLWDPVVRITHWGVALSVLLNGLVTEGGSLGHVWIGWLVLALLLLRMVWGALGPVEARFSAFPPNPAAAVRHLRQLVTGNVQSHRSHNPAGALVIYAFWALLAVVVATGLVMTGGATPMQVAADKAAVESGDWSALIREEGEGEGSSETSEVFEELHEIAANLLLVLAALHVAGVGIESRAMRRNLLAPMLFGERRK